MAEVRLELVWLVLHDRLDPLIAVPAGLIPGEREGEP